MSINTSVPRCHVVLAELASQPVGTGVIWSSGYLLLNGGKRQWYRHTMRAMGELGREGLPRVIPAEELQIMLGTSSAFCSWDASNSMVTELMARWPFLYSQPLMGTNRKPTQ
jgi:hypothetical protein